MLSSLYNYERQAAKLRPRPGVLKQTGIARENPMSREYPEFPMVGVGVVVWKDEEVLLIQRGKPPRVGSWSLPGGRQELGETTREAGVREVLEETGLSVEIKDLIDVVDSINHDDDGRVRLQYYLYFCRCRIAHRKFTHC